VKPAFARNLLLLSLQLFLASFSLSRGASLDGVDLSFNAGSGIDRSINFIFPLTDGKILVGGRFVAVKDFARTAVARLHSDGTADTNFVSVLSPVGEDPHHLADMALLPDGGILIAGHFATPKDRSAHLIKLKPDGTLDESFTLAAPGISDPDSIYVSHILVMLDGRIVFAGSIGDIYKLSNYGIFRLLPDGSLDSSFDPARLAKGYQISKLAFQPDGKILAAVFSGGTAGNLWNFRAVRFFPDGTPDPSFQSVVALGSVNVLMSRSDGKILFGGQPADSSSSSALSLLDSNGRIIPGFASGIFYPKDYQSIASDLHLSSDGKILVCGTFSGTNGIGESNLARLQPDGSLDASFVQPKEWVGVRKIAGLSNGTLLLSGVTRSVPLRTGGLYRHDPRNGGLESLGSLLDASSGALAAIQADGGILILQSDQDVSRPYLARLNSTGALDLGFRVSGLTNSMIRSALALSDGRVLVFGTINSVHGLRVPLARLHSNGAWDDSFGLPAPLPSDIFAIVSQQDGKILLGGSSGQDAAAASPKVSLVRLNSDGTTDESFQPLIGGTVNLISLLPSGKILINHYLQGKIGALARLHADGTMDLAPQVPPYPAAFMAVQPGGKIVILSNRSDNEERHYYLYRLDQDFSFDRSFLDRSILHEEIYSFLMQPDGKIILAGWLARRGVWMAPSLKRFNPDGSADPTFAYTLNRADRSLGMNSLLLQPDGRLLVGGDFSTVNSVSRWNFARLFIDPPLALTAVSSGFELTLSWTTNSPGFTLESTATLRAPSWKPHAGEPAILNGRYTLTATNPAPASYYRLHK